jgi:hypothetical protein
VSTVASYALAIVGFGIMAAGVLKALASNMKYIYTRPLLINALRTNANHAEMMCKKSPDTYWGAIGAALKTAGMMQSRDPKVVPTATLPAYDANGQAVVQKWSTLLGKAKMGLMAAGGAVAVGLTKGVPPIPVIILAVMVGFGYLWLYLYKEEVARCILRARAEVLPEVDSAVIAGRYVFPPLPQ